MYLHSPNTPPWRRAQLNKHRDNFTLNIPVVVLYVVTPAYIFRMKMEAARTSETTTSYHITTWPHNPEDHNLRLHRRENLKSLMGKQDGFLLIR
jgi:hypothetical protein